jgi:hypothetical protein
LKVTLRHVARFDDIFADEAFKRIEQAFKTQATVRPFVVAVVQLYLDDKGGAWNEIDTYARLWGVTHNDADETMLDEISEVATLLQSLYTTYGPDRLRGALFEGLVRGALEPKYATEVLEDNAVITIRNGFNYDSSTDIDVVGWHDQEQVGECHDCKVRSRWFDPDLLKELDLNLPQPEFRIGLVSTDSYMTVVAALRANGVSVSNRMNIIDVEHLPRLAPLHPVKS